MLDRVTELEPGVAIEAIKCWSLSDDVFADHFPGFPIVPGVFHIESMAQSLGLLVERSYNGAFPETDHAVHAVLSVVHKAKFRRLVIPGDQMRIRGELLTLEPQFARGAGTITVDGEECARADLSFFILDSRKLPDNDLAEQREQVVRILTKGKELAQQVSEWKKE